MRRIAMCNFLVFAPTLWAQSPPTITGFLVDSTGAAVPRATVRLLDKTGHEVAKKLTDWAVSVRRKGWIVPG